MAKKRQHSNSDAYESHHSDSGSDFEPVKKKPRKQTRNVQTKPSRVAPQVPHADGGSAGIRSHSKSDHILSTVAPIQEALLQWFSTVRDSRGMPWRKPHDLNLTDEERAQRAYEVWVSEIMLQQTQVATVIPYYNTWMAKFPTIRHLSESSIEDVNALWKGLGYYSRASRLLSGAQKTVREYDGRLPDNAKDMEANIPGIGRYSAGAICSIAYGERVPVLDGNVHRLLSRLLAVHAPPKAKATLDVLWAAATALVQKPDGHSEHPGLIQSTFPQPTDASTENDLEKHPGDINQALIELGSTICKPREPSCTSCPLRPWCLAQIRRSNEGQGTQDIEDMCNLCEPIDGTPNVTIYPMKNERKKAREESDVVTVIEWRSADATVEPQILLLRRPEKGLLAGLYEFPTVPDVSPSLSRGQLLDVGIEQMAAVIQVPVDRPKESGSHTHRDEPTHVYTLVDARYAGDVPHVFSHIKKTYKVQRFVIMGGANPPALRLSFKEVDQPTTLKNGSTLVQATWTPVDKVIDANIGTGVVKVWRLVSSLGKKE